jgi:hypothetical protein
MLVTTILLTFTLFLLIWFESYEFFVDCILQSTDIIVIKIDKGRLVSEYSHHLGTTVIGGAPKVAKILVPYTLLNDFRQAEVDEGRLIQLLADYDVFRFDIAVNDAESMHSPQLLF